MATIKKTGFTLLEVLVVIAISGIITTIIVSTFSLFNKSQALDRDSEAVIESLEQARTHTLASKNANQYGVHFGTSRITIFTGATYSASAADNMDIPLASTDTILTITLVGGGSDVVFNRLTGETSQSGTIVISSPSSSRTRTITIYKTGVIQ